MLIWTAAAAGTATLVLACLVAHWFTIRRIQHTERQETEAWGDAALPIPPPPDVEAALEAHRRRSSWPPIGEAL